MSAPVVSNGRARGCKTAPLAFLIVASSVAALASTASAQQSAPTWRRPTTQQAAALSAMNADLGKFVQSLVTARAELIQVSLTLPLDEDAIRLKAKAIADAELALDSARESSIASIQSSPAKFSPEQLAALATTAGLRPNRQTPSPIPNLTSAQSAALTELTGAVTPLSQNLAAARAAVMRASFADPQNQAAIQTSVDAVTAAELALARKRANAFAAIQSSPNKLTPDQFSAFAAMGGALIAGSFSEPQPLDFNDHVGYVSLFDGTTLKGWDGDPKFWRVEDGAIIGESTPQNPVHNTYLAYRDVQTKDFTLKFEIKIEGNGGSGMQYRSKSGVPWLSAAAANPAPDAPPLNLEWMMTGPQADFWPAKIYSGQFYSENTPMRIMAWRGQVVEGAGLGPRRLMANIADRKALGDLVKPIDWNQYIVIARGGTFIHIINGQLMAVMIDDDPESSNNQPGQFGIEIESTTKVSVRKIWLKKLN